MFLYTALPRRLLSIARATGLLELVLEGGGMAYCPLGGRLLRGTGSDTDERCQGQTKADEKEESCVIEAGLWGS